MTREGFPSSPPASRTLSLFGRYIIAVLSPSTLPYLSLSASTIRMRTAMLAKYSVAFFLPLVHALTLGTPTGLTSGGLATITWTADPTDPPFSLELANPVFRDAFAIGNNIDPTTATSITLTLPAVPVGAGYHLEAVNVGNITDVYARSGEFSIGAATSSSRASSSTTGLTTSTTGLITTTAAGTATGPVRSPAGSTSATGTVPGLTTTTASSGTGIPLKFAPSGIVVPCAVLAFSAFAGLITLAL